jgi:methyltransferase (TIGR00027 family)
MSVEKAPTHKLIGVPETMMVPLYARAVETQREDALFHDPKAVEMIERIDYDFSRFADSQLSNLGVAIRTEIFDELTAAFIEKYPDAVIVNIAAGLDTRFTRVDNGRILWYDLDLPESIEMRSAFFKETERNRWIAKSALDFSWADDVERRDHTLFIVEGLLMYFTEDQVKALIGAIVERFPGAEMLLEVIGVSQSKNTHVIDAVSKTGANFQWGIRHAETMADWDERLIYLEDISLYDRHQDRWFATGVEFPAPLIDLRNTVDRIVHLKVNKR